MNYNENVIYYNMHLQHTIQNLKHGFLLSCTL